MLVDDAVLPAAAHLTGPHARHVLGAALEAVGGRLHLARPCHVQYRPGHDVVVRFDGRVHWANGGISAETLIAATTADGPPPGTLPVEAVTHDGTALSVGVWRWPFDPLVTGLAEAVTPSALARFLDGLCVGRLTVAVVAYRPTLRAVVRAVDEAGSVYYVKALRPGSTDDLVDRHHRLAAAGLPVPAILRHDSSRGLVAMAALPGPTVRDRLKRGDAHLPSADQYEAVYAALGATHLTDAQLVDGRAATARNHGAMLAAVLPSQRPRLEQLADALRPAAERASQRSGATIHGDLYEAQLVTGRGRGTATPITGVLDLDDAGAGDPLDDRATVIAHLLDRALGSTGDRRRRVMAYARALRRSFGEVIDVAELDLVTAGAMVGLATGPFRIQQRRWQQASGRRLATAAHLARSPGEGTLRLSS